MIDNAVTIMGRERQIRLAKDKATEKSTGSGARDGARPARCGTSRNEAGFQVWGADIAPGVS